MYLWQQAYFRRDEESMTKSFVAKEAINRFSLMVKVTSMGFLKSLDITRGNVVTQPSYKAGRVTVKVEPSPIVEPTEIAPPHWSTMR